MTYARHPYPNLVSPHKQRGAATLLVALSLLVILTIIVLTSGNVGLFEQKTATNENREMHANQAAEYALNLGGEYLKANVVNISSKEDDDGWLFPGGTNLHWQPCPENPTDANHPCNAEPNANVRSQLYYYTTDGAVHLSPSTVTADATALDLFPNATATLPTGGPQLTKVGNGAFPVTAKVGALLCLLDTTAGATPSCQLTPSTGNRIAVTLVATRWHHRRKRGRNGQGNLGHVQRFLRTGGGAADCGRLNQGARQCQHRGRAQCRWLRPAWIDVDPKRCRCGRVSWGHGQRDHLPHGGLSRHRPDHRAGTTCAGNGNTGCSCSNVAKGSPDMLSGHFNSYTQESIDVLDVDSNYGSPTSIPDIQFFPGWSNSTSPPGCMDTAYDATHPADAATDDNLFEWIFGQDINGASVCHEPPVTADEVAKENTVLDDLGATHIPNCDSLDKDSSGLYVVDGGCDLKADVGSPNNTVVVVVSGDVTMSSNFNFYGMLYVRDIGAGASFTGHGSSNVFGSVVVEGDVSKINGSLNIIYLDTSTGGPGKKLPATTRFALLPGSWLDNQAGF